LAFEGLASDRNGVVNVRIFECLLVFNVCKRSGRCSMSIGVFLPQNSAQMRLPFFFIIVLCALSWLSLFVNLWFVLKIYNGKIIFYENARLLLNFRAENFRADTCCYFVCETRRFYYTSPLKISYGKNFS
jgi:hypothetical protein